MDTQTITIRVTEKQKKEWKILAKEEYRSLSNWIKLLAEKHIKENVQKGEII